MRLLREPLVHFLALGALLFVLYGRLGVRDAAPDTPVVVTEGDVQALRVRWERQWGRPPTPQEGEGLIRELVNEELLVREARALGLDRDDTVIRRHLANKMRFLTADLSEAREPEEATLRAFFERHLDRYRSSPSIRFEQVYFSPDRRGDAAEADALRALAGLRAADGDAAPPDVGDRLLVEDSARLVDLAAVTRTFGSDFADALLEVPVGGWEGPVASGYGLHLVRVFERSPAPEPDFELHRPRVLEDWRLEERDALEAALLECLREKYGVRFETSDAGDAP